MSSHDNDELIDYEDENDVVPNGATLAAGAADDDKERKISLGSIRLVSGWLSYAILVTICVDHQKVISC